MGTRAAKDGARAERSTSRAVAASCAMVLAGGLALSGCSTYHPPNQTGTGNRFLIHGLVHNVEPDGTIYIDDTTLVIDYAEGRAEFWFHGEAEYNNNALSSPGIKPYYNKAPETIADGCELKMLIGHVFSSNDVEVSLDHLVAGDAISITGAIRDSSKSNSLRQTAYCTSEELPVYETVFVQ